MTNKPSNLTERTARRIREAIRTRALRPGDVFGTEAALGRQLGVSRSILREAINRLRALGLLRGRQGVGLVVGKPDPVAIFEQAFETVLMDSLDLADLAELRYTIEVGAVGLVVRRATAEQLTRLDELAGEFTGGPHRPLKRSIDDIELEFHQAYLEASHSTVVMRMHHVITGFFARAPREMPGWDPWTDRCTVWDHRAIVQALRERSIERARAVLTGHLAGLLRRNECESTGCVDKEKDFHD